MNSRRRKKIANFVEVVIIVSILIIGLILLSRSIKPLTSVDLSSNYIREAHTIQRVKFLETVKVRSEPKVLENSGDGGTNSFGEILVTSGFDVQLEHLYTINEPLDKNGRFYGFLVNEIMATDEGKKFFPEKIKEDPDGIVWINAHYIEVIYPLASQ